MSCQDSGSSAQSPMMCQPSKLLVRQNVTLVMHPTCERSLDALLDAEIEV